MSIDEFIERLNEEKKSFDGIRKNAEYIEKAELIKKICLETAEWYNSLAIRIIRDFPAADVQPAKLGVWRKEFLSDTICCSEY